MVLPQESDQKTLLINTTPVNLRGKKNKYKLSWVFLAAGCHHPLMKLANISIIVLKTSVVDPDPYWSRIQELCGSTHVNIGYNRGNRCIRFRTKIPHSESSAGTYHFFLIYSFKKFLNIILNFFSNKNSGSGCFWIHNTAEHKSHLFNNCSYVHGSGSAS